MRSAVVTAGAAATRYTGFVLHDRLAAMIQVRVLFFGMLKDIAGRAVDSLELVDGSTLRDLVEHYQQGLPKMREMSTSIAMAVNSEYAGLERELKTGDEVGLLPPVSGGAPRTSNVR